MAEIMDCDACGDRMTGDEIALNRKLNGLEPAEFLCLSCLAEELGVTKRYLQIMIENFKESGCTLFENRGDDTPDQGETP